MANRVPFTAYFKIVPDRGSGKRFEIQRSRERIAHLVWRDLNDVMENALVENGGTAPHVANFAAPGGSITWMLATADADSLSTSMSAVSVKPQFGEFPDTLTVVGFYESDFTLPYKEMSLISAGRVWKGPASGAHGWTPSTSPSSDVSTAAVALKAALEAAIISVPVEMIKLEIDGVKFGQGGHHFPR